MNDFLLIFRADYGNIPKASAEELQERTQKWMNWIGGIAAQNKLTDRGNRLFPTGKIVRPDNIITDGPYMEIKEAILGYSLVKAVSYDDAVELRKGCPVLAFGGNVEVREISQILV